MAEGKTTVSSEHVFDVLRLVAAAGRPIGASEVAATLKLSHTTAHRALLTLLEVKAIDRSFGGSKYHPGVLTHELLDSLYNRFAIRAASYPTLRRLAASTGETASMGILLGWYGIRIAAIGGWKPNRVSRVGKYTSLNSSSAGRCMLAFSPAQAREDYLAKGLKIRFTEDTPTEVADLKRRIDAIRAQGYEVDIGGVFDDVASVSFPIRLAPDHCIASITIEGPRFQFDPHNDPLLPDWIAAVALLEQEVQANPQKFIPPFSELKPEALLLP
ncbi:MAG: IclR family transcriptional regulator [Pseudomonadota bacterium]